MNEQDVPLYKLILEIRGAFQDLKALSDGMNDDIGVTAAHRAVMESLYGRTGRTVPQIAKAKNVSRQHIQLLVDTLVAKGVLEFTRNPDHKSSRLVGLTDMGRQLFEQIRAQEAKKMAQLSAHLDTAALNDAVRVLRELRRSIGKS